MRIRDILMLLKTAPQKSIVFILNKSLFLLKEGLGKLFSFGGLGIWTLVDVVLIYVGYVGPSDGSIYI